MLVNGASLIFYQLLDQLCFENITFHIQNFHLEYVERQKAISFFLCFVCDIERSWMVCSLTEKNKLKLKLKIYIIRMPFGFANQEVMDYIVGEGRQPQCHITYNLELGCFELVQKESKSYNNTCMESTNVVLTMKNNSRVINQLHCATYEELTMAQDMNF